MSKRDFEMDQKEHVNVVFVVLTYGNTKDVVDLIESTKKVNATYRIVIVNSFYNDETLAKLKQIANEYHCDFIPVENKGYSFGNNRGIEYANKKYDYDYLIISNPDIIINKLNYKDLNGFDGCAVGPRIITSTGKNQNPFYVDKKIFAGLEYYFLKKRIKIGYYSIIAINKIKKMLFFAKMRFLKQKTKKIFALHGSFIILSKRVIDCLGTVFDENLFLFCEEMVLAEELKKKNISSIYTENVEVSHKEDGCMKFLEGSMYEEEVKSNGYVYNKYYKKSV